VLLSVNLTAAANDFSTRVSRAEKPSRGGTRHSEKALGGPTRRSLLHGWTLWGRRSFAVPRILPMGGLWLGLIARSLSSYESESWSRGTGGQETGGRTDSGSQEVSPKAQECWALRAVGGPYACGKMRTERRSECDSTSRYSGLTSAFTLHAFTNV